MVETSSNVISTTTKISWWTLYHKHHCLRCKWSKSDQCIRLGNWKNLVIKYLPYNIYSTLFTLKMACLHSKYHKQLTLKKDDSCWRVSKASTRNILSHVSERKNARFMWQSFTCVLAWYHIEIMYVQLVLLN